MRLLWISVLLFGHVVCVPVDKSSSSSLSSLPNPSSYMATGGSADSSYPSFRDEGYSSPGVVYAASHTGGYNSGAPSVGYSGYGGYGGYSGGYGGSAGGYAESGSYGFDPAPGGEDLSAGPAAGDGAGVEAPEPVFSDVSDLEPVYSFSSRSSYQQGRSVFAQTRYIPREPAPPPMPVYRDTGKTSKGSSSSDVPTKGGF